jgi:nucleotide-binding universal stress UspA family protein
MEHGVDPVVMSTHGRTGIGRVLMGCVAGEVLRFGRAPLLLVGPAAERPAPNAAQGATAGV